MPLISVRRRLKDVSVRDAEHDRVRPLRRDGAAVDSREKENGRLGVSGDGDGRRFVKNDIVCFHCFIVVVNSRTWCLVAT